MSRLAVMGVLRIAVANRASVLDVMLEEFNVDSEVQTGSKDRGLGEWHSAR